MNLKEVRCFKQLTPIQASLLVGYSPSSYRKIERGANIGQHSQVIYAGVFSKLSNATADQCNEIKNLESKDFVCVQIKEMLTRLDPEKVAKILEVSRDQVYELLQLGSKHLKWNKAKAQRLQTYCHSNEKPVVKKAVQQQLAIDELKPLSNDAFATYTLNLADALTQKGYHGYSVKHIAASPHEHMILITPKHISKTRKQNS